MYSLGICFVKRFIPDSDPRESVYSYFIRLYRLQKSTYKFDKNHSYLLFNNRYKMYQLKSSCILKEVNNLKEKHYTY